jgi:holo-[acyl-carrier protein] synthase
MQAPFRVRVGVDIVSVARIARVDQRRPRFGERVFTPSELAYCRGRKRQHEHMAARFAAKEAVLKAFGTGLGEGMRWTDLEIDRDSGGRPLVRLSGAAAAWADREGLADIDLSLSHTGELAIAHVVAVLRATG